MDAISSFDFLFNSSVFVSNVFEITKFQPLNTLSLATENVPVNPFTKCQVNHAIDF